MENKINLEKIRNMSDENLLNYLSYLQNKNISTCAMCYEPNGLYTVHIKKNDKYPSMRKACCLCEDCYLKLMDYLGVPPIEW